MDAFALPLRLWIGDRVVPHPTLITPVPFLMNDYSQWPRPPRGPTIPVLGALGTRLLPVVSHVVRRGRDGRARGRAVLCVCVVANAWGKGERYGETHASNMRECCKCSSKPIVHFLGFPHPKTKSGIRKRTPGSWFNRVMIRD